MSNSISNSICRDCHGEDDDVVDECLPNLHQNGRLHTHEVLDPSTHGVSKLMTLAMSFSLKPIAFDVMEGDEDQE